MLDIRGYNGVGQHPLLVLPVMLRVCSIYCIAHGGHAPWFAPCFGRGIAHRMDKAAGLPGGLLQQGGKTRMICDAFRPPKQCAASAPKPLYKPAKIAQTAQAANRGVGRYNSCAVGPTLSDPYPACDHQSIQPGGSIGASMSENQSTVQSALPTLDRSDPSLCSPPLHGHTIHQTNA